MNNTQSAETPGHTKTYSIIVNGRRREVSDHKLTYLQVVQLAYPGEVPTETIVFTVTYSNPHGRDGSLTEGQGVVIKDHLREGFRERIDHRCHEAFEPHWAVGHALLRGEHHVTADAAQDFLPARDSQDRADAKPDQYQAPAGTLGFVVVHRVAAR